MAGDNNKKVEKSVFSEYKWLTGAYWLVALFLSGFLAAEGVLALSWPAQALALMTGLGASSAMATAVVAAGIIALPALVIFLLLTIWHNNLKPENRDRTRAALFWGRVVCVLLPMVAVMAVASPMIAVTWPILLAMVTAPIAAAVGRFTFGAMVASIFSPSAPMAGSNVDSDAAAAAATHQDPLKPGSMEYQNLVGNLGRVGSDEGAKVEELKRYLNAGLIEPVTGDDRIILCANAIEEGHMTIADFWLDQGGVSVDAKVPDSTEGRHQNPLLSLVVMGCDGSVDSISELRAFLQRKPDVNAVNIYGKAPLHYAARKDRLAVVTLLCEQSVALGFSLDLDLKDNKGMSALAHALDRGLPRVALYLLEQGASTDGLSEDHTAYLERIQSEAAAEDAAAASDVVAVVEASHEGAGAAHEDSAAADEPPTSQEALQAAVEACNWALIAAFAEEDGASMQAVTQAAKDASLLAMVSTPGWAAASNTVYNVFCMLLDNGANPNGVDPKTGNTILHYVQRHGEDRYMTKLLQFKPNATVENQEGHTALEMAKQAVLSPKRTQSLEAYVGESEPGQAEDAAEGAPKVADLVAAIKAENQDRFFKVLATIDWAEGEFPEYPNANKVKACFAALETNKPAVLEAVLKATGLNVNASASGYPKGKSVTLLYKAMSDHDKNSCDRSAVIKYLLNHDAINFNVRCSYEDGKANDHLLWLMFSKFNSKGIRAHLANNRNLDALDADGKPALAYALAPEHRNIFCALIDAGADVGALQGEDKAAYDKIFDETSALKPDRSGDYDLSVCQWPNKWWGGILLGSAGGGNDALVKAIMGLPSFDQVPNQEEAFFDAVKAGHLAVVQAFVDAKTGLVEEVDRDGSSTALHYALDHKRREVALYLVDKGADTTDGLSEGQVAYLATIQSSAPAEGEATEGSSVAGILKKVDPGAQQSGPRSVKKRVTIVSPAKESAAAASSGDEDAAAAEEASPQDALQAALEVDQPDWGAIAGLAGDDGTGMNDIAVLVLTDALRKMVSVDGWASSGDAVYSVFCMLLKAGADLDAEYKPNQLIRDHVFACQPPVRYRTAITDIKSERVAHQAVSAASM